MNRQLRRKGPGVLLLVLLVFCGVASAGGAPPPPNSIAAAEVMFDSPTATGVPVALTGSTGDVIREALEGVDLSALSSGPHTVYVRFQDSEGDWSQPIGQSFHIHAGLTPGQENALAAAEVFIDTDPGVGNATALTLQPTTDAMIAEALGSLDISTLPPGLHSLYLRTRDASGARSSTLSFPFLVSYIAGNQPDRANTVTRGEYRIDNADFAFKQADDGQYNEASESLYKFLKVPKVYHRSETRYQDLFGTWSDASPLPAFLVNDVDRDGIPDSYEIAEFGFLGYTGSDDPDGDSKTIAEELYEGTDPGDPVGGSLPLISGYVTTDGTGVAGIQVCIEGPGLLRCDALTDSTGFYILNGGQPLPDGDWTVYPRSTTASTDLVYTPVSQSVTLSGSEVNNVNFDAVNPFAGSKVKTRMLFQLLLLE